MPEVPPPGRCRSYAPGHSVHWIQALHSANKPAVARRTRQGVLTAVDGDVLSVCFGHVEEPEALRNHDPARLRAIAGPLPRAVSVNDEYCLLRVGPYCFSVHPAEDAPLGRCRYDDLVDGGPAALANRTHTHGGFSVSRSSAGLERPNAPGEAQTVHEGQFQTAERGTGTGRDAVHVRAAQGVGA